MANLTYADGTLTLVGNWTAEDVDLVNQVVKSWAFNGYGLCCGPFSVDDRENPFFGDGAWDFYNVLDSIPEWTEQWIEHPKPGTDHPLARETYEALIRAMAEKDLHILVTFTEECYGGDDKEDDEEHKGAFHGEVEEDGENRFYSLWYEDLDEEEEEDDWDDEEEDE